MHRLIVFSLILFCIISLLSCDKNDNQIRQEIKYDLFLLSNDIIYKNDNHNAFTSLIEYKGDKYLAFREGNAHRPSSIENYGHISIIHENKGTWVKDFDLFHPDMDLRDPFFISIDGHIRLYCGYNQFVDEKYQHSGTVYSDLTEKGWTEFTQIKHDVPHIIWLWKIRKYNDLYYGVGYLEGEKSVLLESKDGISWVTVTEFQIEGVLTEADMCFLNDTMYVCMRQDTPHGTPSHWGVAKYPFRDFKWSKMNLCVHSPELYCIPESNQIILAGRLISDEVVSVSVFWCNRLGKVKQMFDLYSNTGDMGYPSIGRYNNEIWLSYYYGIPSKTVIGLAKFKLSEVENNDGI